MLIFHPRLLQFHINIYNDASGTTRALATSDFIINTGVTLNSITGTVSDTLFVLKGFTFTIAANTVVGTGYDILTTKILSILTDTYTNMGYTTKTANVSWPCSNPYGSGFYINRVSISKSFNTTYGSVVIIGIAGSGNAENKLVSAQSYTWSNLNIKLPVFKW